MSDKIDLIKKTKIEDETKIHPRRRSKASVAPLSIEKYEQKSQKLSRYKARKKIDWERVIIPAAAVTTGALVALATPQLIDTTGYSGMLKMVLMGSAAALISWVINHHAVEYGAELAATGLRLAGVASVAAILITGSAAFSFSYSGIVLDRVDQLNQSEHGQNLAALLMRLIAIPLNLISSKR